MPDAAQVRFEEAVAALVLPAGPPPLSQWHLHPWRVCSFHDPIHFHPSLPPHPWCADALLLTVEPFLNDPKRSIQECYQVPARRVAGRHR